LLLNACLYVALNAFPACLADAFDDDDRWYYVTEFRYEDKTSIKGRRYVIQQLTFSRVFRSETSVYAQSTFWSIPSPQCDYRRV
jgi:hypothetical protein